MGDYDPKLLEVLGPASHRPLPGVVSGLEDFRAEHCLHVTRQVWELVVLHVVGGD